MLGGEHDTPSRSAVGGIIAVLGELIQWEQPRDDGGMASSVSGVLYFPHSGLSVWSCQAFD